MEHIDLFENVISAVTQYRGRFAPTPSGPLHLGSLFTALASWLAARQAQGRWLLRLDDLDGPRCAPGAETVILRQLEAHGLHWDDEVVRQSEHGKAYHAALATLQAEGWLYVCKCTRARLASSSLAGIDGPRYAGCCRELALALAPGRALRLRLPRGLVQWDDSVLGPIQRRTPEDCSDFVVQRADGQISYQLACAIDEQRMGITEVLRGSDLMGSTVQQRAVTAALGLVPPRHGHVPTLNGVDGCKLSKQHGARALRTDPVAVSRQLGLCLQLMGCAVPAALAGSNAQALLSWALTHCNRNRLPKAKAITMDALPC